MFELRLKACNHKRLDRVIAATKALLRRPPSPRTASLGSQLLPVVQEQRKRLRRP